MYLGVLKKKIVLEHRNVSASGISEHISNFFNVFWVNELLYDYNKVVDS